MGRKIRLGHTAKVQSKVWDIFAQCDADIRAGELITRLGSRDKEFHFQDWFQERIVTLGLRFEAGGRNSYPDFRLVASTEGYEVKGLAYPGREADYDCNSQVPSGEHNGRTIFYVFGRYPKDPEGNSYPVVDLVICHGDLLNTQVGYVHINRSIRAFGSYGDILLRDRKMYVAPTPFALLEGTTGLRTLIVPAVWRADDRYSNVGSFDRFEVDELMSAYTFDLVANQLTPRFMPNPNAGSKHSFSAYRLKDSGAGKLVKLNSNARNTLPSRSLPKWTDGNTSQGEART